MIDSNVQRKQSTFVHIDKIECRDDCKVVMEVSINPCEQRHMHYLSTFVGEDLWMHLSDQPLDCDGEYIQEDPVFGYEPLLGGWDKSWKESCDGLLWSCWPKEISDGQ